MITLQMRPDVAPGTMRRTLTFTDGLANVGIVDPDQPYDVVMKVQVDKCDNAFP